MKKRVKKAKVIKNGVTNLKHENIYQNQGSKRLSQAQKGGVQFLGLYWDPPPPGSGNTWLYGATPVESRPSQSPRKRAYCSVIMMQTFASHDKSLDNVMEKCHELWNSSFR